MANRFLTRLAHLGQDEDSEESYAPKQRGVGRRIFEGIRKKKRPRFGRGLEVINTRNPLEEDEE